MKHFLILSAFCLFIIGGCAGIKELDPYQKEIEDYSYSTVDYWYSYFPAMRPSIKKAMQDGVITNSEFFSLSDTKNNLYPPLSRKKELLEKIND